MAPGNGQQKLDRIPVLALTCVRGPQRASSLAGSGNQGPSALELPGEQGRALGIRVLGPLAAGDRAGSGGPEAARLPKTPENETEEEPHRAWDGPLHCGARSEAETPSVTRRSAHHFPGLPDQSSTKWGRKWIPRSTGGRKSEMEAVTRLLPSGCPEREPAPPLGWQLLAMLVSLGLQRCPFQSRLP